MQNSVKSCLKMLVSRRQDEDLAGLFVKGSSGTFLLQTTNTLLTFLTSLLLARMLGASGYGIYTYAMAWVTLLAVLTGLGLPKVVIRNVAIYRAEEAWGLLRGSLRYANLAVFLVSTAIVGFGYYTVRYLLVYLDSETALALTVALLILPLQSLTTVSEAALQGLQRIVLGQLGSMLVRPSLFIIFIAGVGLLSTKYMNATLALLLRIFAAALALIVVAIFFRHCAPPPARVAVPEHQLKVWLTSALPLLLVSGMFILNSRADLLMVGTIKGAEAAGVYQVASRGAELVMFVLTAINVPFSPLIARLYSTQEMVQLQRIVTKSARAAFFLSLPIGVFLMVAGHWFLFIFGADFITGRPALAILSFGQLLNVAAGPVGLLLIMTGHEREAARGVGMSTISNLLLNAALIPIWGIEGAAIATAISIVVWNGMLLWYVRSRLGLHSTVLGPVHVYGAK